MSEPGTLRMTRQRRVILEELAAVTSHPTADELYQRVRRRLPRVSLGTVYRNLEIMAQKGEIQRIGAAGTQRRFDATTAMHYHIRCTSCGRVADLPLKPVNRLEQEAARTSGFTISGHWAEFQGVCPECQVQPNV
jgi:Fur family transcriptional regulator, ferric uptake regulator